MKEKAAAERAKKKLKELMAKAGVSEEQLKVFDDHVIHEADFVKSLEVEGILLSLYSEKLPVKTKICKKCEQPFATNYMYVAYCSDHCRARSLEEIGILWNPHKKPEERWGSEVYRNQIPIVISPEALNNLKTLLKDISDLESQALLNHQEMQNQEYLVEPLDGVQTQIQNVEQALEFPPEDQQKKTHSVLEQGVIAHMIDQVYSADPLYRKIRDDLGIEGYTPPDPKDERTIQQEELAENTSPQPFLPEHTAPESQEAKSVFRFL